MSLEEVYDRGVKKRAKTKCHIIPCNLTTRYNHYNNTSVICASGDDLPAKNITNNNKNNNKKIRTQF